MRAVASITSRFNGCMEPALGVGLPPACENAEAHSLAVHRKCDRIETKEIISNVCKSNSARARPPDFYQRPHSSFIVRARTSSSNAATYRSKLSLFFFAFFPIFASLYLILWIRPDTCAYMRVPSRSYADLIHLAQAPRSAYGASTLLSLQIPTLDYL